MSIRTTEETTEVKFPLGPEGKNVVDVPLLNMRYTLAAKDPVLTVSETSWMPDYKTASTRIDVDYEGSWFVVKDDDYDWIDVVVNGPNSFYINVTANDTNQQRVTSLTVTAKGADPDDPMQDVVRQVGVWQDPMTENDVTLGLYPIAVNVDYEAANPVNVAVKCEPEASWQVRLTEPWITVDPVAGAGNANLTVTIAENDAPTERTGTLLVSSKWRRWSIPVTQGPAPYLDLEPAAVHGEPGEAIATEVQVITNQGAWNAVSSDSWLTVTPGDEKFTLAATALANGSQPRAATVTVTAGPVTKTLGVTQSALSA